MKPWHERPLWQKVFMEDDKVYLMAGKIIGHLGCDAFAFHDAAKKLPNYDKLRYENAVRDLTLYTKREQGQYELTTQARKVLRVIIGPAPDDPEYRRWWTLRLVSVKAMKGAGQKVEWAEEPPVPLGPAEGEAPPKPPKKRPAKEKMPAPKGPARRKG